VIPILNIYRKYYGIRVTTLILTTFYASMAGGTLVIDFLFEGLGLIPEKRNARVVEAAIAWNYTTFLISSFSPSLSYCYTGFSQPAGHRCFR
jgi:hypothetical protein